MTDLTNEREALDAAVQEAVSEWVTFKSAGSLKDRMADKLSAAGFRRQPAPRVVRTVEVDVTHIEDRLDEMNQDGTIDYSTYSELRDLVDTLEPAPVFGVTEEQVDWIVSLLSAWIAPRVGVDRVRVAVADALRAAGIPVKEET